jgi:undecaprenyl diphosphate synthase
MYQGAIERTPTTRPRHVAIIMDGNGRWAAEPRPAADRRPPRGADRVREVVESCPDLGVTHLTLFAFSTENWKRPEQEVQGLFRLCAATSRRRARGSCRGRAGALHRRARAA